MKKVLYITNIEVPYKVKFFNEIAKKADLTVVYERRSSSNRDEKWAKSEKVYFKKEYLNGIKIGNENAFSFSLLKYLNKEYDVIIISCINSYVQLMAILYLKLVKKKYVLSFDGEAFIGTNGLKNSMKKWFIRGADKYLTAGEKSADSLYGVVKPKEVYPYYFSSFTNEELLDNSKANSERQQYVLVIGQYFDYKGLDIAVRVARRDSNINYKFIGTGKRTDLFRQELHLDADTNIEVISFLNKEDLNREYQKAKVLFLPSRQECWGLVVNEAASFGTPIVSTVGSGAAVEFLNEYPEKYIFTQDDEEGMYNAIKRLVNNDCEAYSDYLRRKSLNYSIEKMEAAHEKALNL